jgi:hypothetical protein
MANDIKIFKFTSGETIIAKVMNTNGDVIRVKKPISVFFQETPKGIQVHFSPFAPFSLKEEIDVERQAIQYQSLANPNIESQYTSATSGLVVPESPSLILE